MSEPTNELKTATSWLQQHERLVIIFMVLIFSFFVVYKGFELASTWENHKATQAQAVLEAQKAKNDTDLATAKTMLSTYQDQLANATKEIESLTAAQASRDRVVVVQQKADAALPPSELALRWQGLVGDNGVQPVAAGFEVSPTAAIDTVQNLEQVPVLKADLADEQAKTAALTKDVTDANMLIGQGKTVVNGLQLQLTDQTKADTLALKAEKAKGRKNVLKSFGVGFVTGFIAGVTVHLW